MAKIKVKLKKSMISRHKKNKRIAAALGLKRVGDTKVFEKNSAIMGMVRKIDYPWLLVLLTLVVILKAKYKSMNG